MSRDIGGVPDTDLPLTEENPNEQTERTVTEALDELVFGDGLGASISSTEEETLAGYDRVTVRIDLELQDAGATVDGSLSSLNIGEGLAVSADGETATVSAESSGGGGLTVIKEGSVNINSGATETVTYPKNDGPVLCAVECTSNANAQVSITYGGDPGEFGTRSVRLENVGFSSASWDYKILSV